MKTSTENRRSSKPVLFVGLDVHKQSIAVAVAEGGRQGEVRHHGSIAHDLPTLEKLLGKLQRQGSTLRVCYEAGPCGFGLARRLLELGIDCQVIAPSLIPKRSGDRQKTDRRDAAMLARLHRAAELTPVQIPEQSDEALRDLCRARTDAVNDLRRTRQQLQALLLRLGCPYPGKTSWTLAHERYLRALVLPNAAHQNLLEESVQALGAAKERVERITGRIEALARDWRLWPAVEALMCLRGIRSLSAILFLSELGDLSRFAHPGKLMAYLGLLPSEHSSGESVRKGSITKCGNAHVRWILIEAAQHYCRPPRVSRALRARQQGQPRRLVEISWQTQNRLYRRFRTLSARDKVRQKIVTAMARELAGFLWAVFAEWQHPGSIAVRPAAVCAPPLASRVALPGTSEDQKESRCAGGNARGTTFPRTPPLGGTRNAREREKGGAQSL